jgi:aconitate hydratase
MYKAANARLLLRSLSSNSAASASVPVNNPRLAAASSSSSRLALSLPCGAWVGRSSGLVRAAGWSGTRPRFAGARAQIGAAAVPAVERFQRRMATQGACAWGLPSGFGGVVWLSRTGPSGAI